jgi:hypothetical protein
MILPGADGSIGAGRAARARPHGYTIDVGFLGNHVLNGGFYSLQYYVLNDFARILPLVRASVVLFARKTLSANDLNELIDRLVEGQSQQGDGGSRRRGSALAIRLLSERNRDPFCRCALSWHSPANAGLGSWSDRPHFQYTGSAATDAGREHKSLCGDKRQTHGGGIRHPDLCRDGTTGGFLFSLDWTFRAQRHADGHHRQAQRRGRGGTGRPVGGDRHRRRSVRCRRLMPPNGGRSSRSSGSRRSSPRSRVWVIFDGSRVWAGCPLQLRSLRKYTAIPD